MRIGIFGGSFDPIHFGHLILAEQCREQARLDQIWFVPSSLQPHKRDGAHGTDRQRTEMIELAISGHDAFVLSKLELERGGVSYTIDTISQIRQSNPDDELFLLMGDDSLESFKDWHQPQEICQQVTPLVVNRPGSGEVDLSVLESYVDAARYEQFQQHVVRSPEIEISSRQIRANLKNGKSIRYWLPRSVQKYVETQKIYLS